MRFLPKSRVRVGMDSHVSNPTILRQSVIELRGVYSNLTDDEYYRFYENKYGVKANVVKEILRSDKDE